MIEQGRSSGGPCYGYDAVSDPALGGGLRAINQAEAAIIRWIFTGYAAGETAVTLAAGLNARGVAGPRNSGWSFSTILGNTKRGNGILNNELYCGRLVWNRQHFFIDRVTGRRQAQLNPEELWVIAEVPDLRIIDDALWAAVKTRQKRLSRG